MTEKRPSPYAYVTWLADHMSGNMMCDFKLWWRGNFKNWRKPPNNFDQENWMIAHTALLREIRNEYRDQERYTVKVEDQNSFWQDHFGVTVSGKADIVVIDDVDGIIKIIDAKTGKPSASHGVQVQLYMHFLTLEHTGYQNYQMHGELRYANDPTKSVPYPDDEEGVYQRFHSALDAAVAVIQSVEPPLATPSKSECGWCDITHEDCDDRIEASF